MDRYKADGDSDASSVSPNWPDHRAVAFGVPLDDDEVDPSVYQDMYTIPTHSQEPKDRSAERDGLRGWAQAAECDATASVETHAVGVSPEAGPSRGPQTHGRALGFTLRPPPLGLPGSVPDSGCSSGDERAQESQSSHSARSESDARLADSPRDSLHSSRFDLMPSFWNSMDIGRSSLTGVSMEQALASQQPPAQDARAVAAVGPSQASSPPPHHSASQPPHAAVERTRIDDDNENDDDNDAIKSMSGRKRVSPLAAEPAAPVASVVGASYDDIPSLVVQAAHETTDVHMRSPDPTPETHHTRPPSLSPASTGTTGEDSKWPADARGPQLHEQAAGGGMVARAREQAGVSVQVTTGALEWELARGRSGGYGSGELLKGVDECAAGMDNGAAQETPDGGGEAVLGTMIVSASRTDGSHAVFHTCRTHGQSAVVTTGTPRAGRRLEADERSPVALFEQDLDAAEGFHTAMPGPHPRAESISPFAFQTMLASPAAVTPEIGGNKLHHKDCGPTPNVLPSLEAREATNIDTADRSSAVIPMFTPVATRTRGPPPAIETPNTFQFPPAEGTADDPGPTPGLGGVEWPGAAEQAPCGAGSSDNAGKVPIAMLTPVGGGAAAQTRLAGSTGLSGRSDGVEVNVRASMQVMDRSMELRMELLRGTGDGKQSVTCVSPVMAHRPAAQGVARGVSGPGAAQAAGTPPFARLMRHLNAAGKAVEPSGEQREMSRQAATGGDAQAERVQVAPGPGIQVRAAGASAGSARVQEQHASLDLSANAVEADDVAMESGRMFSALLRGIAQNQYRSPAVIAGSAAGAGVAAAASPASGGPSPAGLPSQAAVVLMGMGGLDDPESPVLMACSTVRVDSGPGCSESTSVPHLQRSPLSGSIVAVGSTAGGSQSGSSVDCDGRQSPNVSPSAWPCAEADDVLEQAANEVTHRDNIAGEAKTMPGAAAADGSAVVSAVSAGQVADVHEQPVLPAVDGPQVDGTYVVDKAAAPVGTEAAEAAALSSESTTDAAAVTGAPGITGKGVNMTGTPVSLAPGDVNAAQRGAVADTDRQAVSVSPSSRRGNHAVDAPVAARPPIGAMTPPSGASTPMNQSPDCSSGAGKCRGRTRTASARVSRELVHSGGEWPTSEWLEPYLDASPVVQTTAATMPVLLPCDLASTEGMPETGMSTAASLVELLAGQHGDASCVADVCMDASHTGITVDTSCLEHEPDCSESQLLVQPLSASDSEQPSMVFGRNGGAAGAVVTRSWAYPPLDDCVSGLIEAEESASVTALLDSCSPERREEASSDAAAGAAAGQPAAEKVSKPETQLCDLEFKRASDGRTDEAACGGGLQTRGADTGVTDGERVCCQLDASLSTHHGSPVDASADDERCVDDSAAGAVQAALDVSADDMQQKVGQGSVVYVCEGLQVHDRAGECTSVHADHGAETSIREIGACLVGPGGQTPGVGESTNQVIPAQCDSVATQASHNGVQEHTIESQRPVPSSPGSPSNAFCVSPTAAPSPPAQLALPNARIDGFVEAAQISQADSASPAPAVSAMDSPAVPDEPKRPRRVMLDSCDVVNMGEVSAAASLEAADIACADDGNAMLGLVEDSPGAAQMTVGPAMQCESPAAARGVESGVDCGELASPQLGASGGAEDVVHTSSPVNLGSITSAVRLQLALEEKDRDYIARAGGVQALPGMRGGDAEYDALDASPLMLQPCRQDAPSSTNDSPTVMEPQLGGGPTDEDPGHSKGGVQRPDMSCSTVRVGDSVTSQAGFPAGAGGGRAVSACADGSVAKNPRLQFGHPGGRPRTEVSCSTVVVGDMATSQQSVTSAHPDTQAPARVCAPVIASSPSKASAISAVDGECDRQAHKDEEHVSHNADMCASPGQQTGTDGGDGLDGAVAGAARLVVTARSLPLPRIEEEARVSDENHVPCDKGLGVPGDMNGCGDSGPNSGMDEGCVPSAHSGEVDATSPGVECDGQEWVGYGCGDHGDTPAHDAVSMDTGGVSAWHDVGLQGGGDERHSGNSGTQSVLSFSLDAEGWTPPRSVTVTASMREVMGPTPKAGVDAAAVELGLGLNLADDLAPAEATSPIMFFTHDGKGTDARDGIGRGSVLRSMVSPAAQHVETLRQSMRYLELMQLAESDSDLAVGSVATPQCQRMVEAVHRACRALEPGNAGGESLGPGTPSLLSWMQDNRLPILESPPAALKQLWREAQLAAQMRQELQAVRAKEQMQGTSLPPTPGATQASVDTLQMFRDQMETQRALGSAENAMLRETITQLEARLEEVSTKLAARTEEFAAATGLPVSGELTSCLLEAAEGQLADAGNDADVECDAFEAVLARLGGFEETLEAARLACDLQCEPLEALFSGLRGVVKRLQARADRSAGGCARVLDMMVALRVFVCNSGDSIVSLIEMYEQHRAGLSPDRSDVTRPGTPGEGERAVLGSIRFHLARTLASLKEWDMKLAAAATSATFADSECGHEGGKPKVDEEQEEASWGRRSDDAGAEVPLSVQLNALALGAKGFLEAHVTRSAIFSDGRRSETPSSHSGVLGGMSASGAAEAHAGTRASTVLTSAPLEPLDDTTPVPSTNCSQSVSASMMTLTPPSQAERDDAAFCRRYRALHDPALSTPVMQSLASLARTSAASFASAEGERVAAVAAEMARQADLRVNPLYSVSQGPPEVHTPPALVATGLVSHPVVLSDVDAAGAMLNTGSAIGSTGVAVGVLDAERCVVTGGEDKENCGSGSGWGCVKGGVDESPASSTATAGPGGAGSRIPRRRTPTALGKEDVDVGGQESGGSGKLADHMAATKVYFSGHSGGSESSSGTAAGGRRGAIRVRRQRPAPHFTPLELSLERRTAKAYFGERLDQRG